MTEFLEFNLEQAFEEIKSRGEDQAVSTKEAYDELVEDYITEKLEVGELNVDEDTEGMIEDLKHLWPRYEENMNVEMVVNEDEMAEKQNNNEE